MKPTLPGSREKSSPPPSGARPRVLVVVPRLSAEIYGGTRSTLLAVQHLRRVEPVVLVVGELPGDPLVEELRGAGVAHRVVGYPAGRGRGRGRLGGALHLLEWNRTVARHVRDLAPDVVHVDAEWFFHAAPAARRLGVPVVHHLRGIQSTGTVRWFRQLALLLAQRNVAVSHSLREFYASGTHPVLRARVARKLATVYNPFRLGDAASPPGAPRDEVRRSLGIEPDQVAVGIVGGIWEAKGQLPFLDRVAPAVAAAHPGVRFHLVGGARDPVYAERCVDAVRRHGLADRVRFHGYSPEVHQWYRVLDVLALPSLREGFGRVAVEAQSFAVPVVASDIIGVRDAVEDGVGGLLAATPDEWIVRLLRICTDAPLRAELGRQGREWVRRFDAAAVAQEMEEVYAALAATRTA